MLIGLIERWERLRGYDKWVETDAKISSSKAEKTAHTDRDGRVTYSYASNDTLRWTDQSGEAQYASFKVPDGSLLYQIVEGESVRIRYNPARPEQFYFRELLEMRVRTAVKMLVAALVFSALLLGAAWLRTH